MALLVPMNALMVASIIKLANLSRAPEYSRFQYVSRQIAKALESQFARYLAIAQVLAACPCLDEDGLMAFQMQAAAAFPDASEAWAVLSTAEGREILKTSPSFSGGSEGMAAQRRAFEKKSPVIGGVYPSEGTGKWFASIEYPIFRDGKPFRLLTIGISAQSFFRLLDAQSLPDGWIAGIADTHGRFVARSIANAALLGQPVSDGWQAALEHTGMFQWVSPEGSKLAGTAEISPLSGWTIGVAAKESVLEAPVWATLRWAGSAGLSVFLFSLMLAILVARRITSPIRKLEQNAFALVSGGTAAPACGPPEVSRVWAALQTAASARQQLEHDLRVSEEMLRTAAEGARFGAYDLDAVANHIQLSAHLKKMMGFASNGREFTPETALSLIHPEDREPAKALIGEVLRGGQRHYEFEYRILGPDGEVCWVLDRGQTFTDASGRVVRLIGILIDVTERKLCELRQQMLLKELSHRVKNTLAIVQSIAIQTSRSTKDPAQFVDIFSARLMLLANVHRLLMERAWEGAALSSIVKEAIAPFLASKGEGVFKIGGPDVDIPAESTITLALMLHELLSNAAKFGALSAPCGRVTISWEVKGIAGGSQLCLHWAEEGGPQPAEPKRQGFGTRLLTMSAEQLDGRIVFAYPPSGLRCDLYFPLQVSQNFFYQPLESQQSNPGPACRSLSAHPHLLTAGKAKKLDSDILITPDEL